MVLHLKLHEPAPDAVPMPSRLRLTVRPLGRADPIALFRRARRGRRPFFLDSSLGHPELARYSFLGSNPIGWFRSRGRRAAFAGPWGEESQVGDPFDSLERFLDGLPWATAGTPAYPFLGGVVGYLSYDLGRMLETLDDHKAPDLQIPDIHLAIYPRVIAIDRVWGEAFVIAPRNRIGFEPPPIPDDLAVPADSQPIEPLPAGVGVRASALADAVDVRRVSRRGRPPHPLREPGAFPPRPRAGRRDAADQGDATPGTNALGGPCARRRTAREREGRRGERDDRRPRAQRSREGLRFRERSHSLAAGAAVPPERAPPGERRPRAPAARCQDPRPDPGDVSRRLDHRGAEAARDGDHRVPRAAPPGRLHRGPRIRLLGPVSGLEHRDSHRDRDRRDRVLRGRRRHRRGLRSGGGVPGDPRQAPRSRGGPHAGSRGGDPGRASRGLTAPSSRRTRPASRSGTAALRTATAASRRSESIAADPSGSRLISRGSRGAWRPFGS